MVDSGHDSHAELQSEATVARTSKDLEGLADQLELGPKRLHTQVDHVVQWPTYEATTLLRVW